MQTLPFGAVHYARKCEPPRSNLRSLADEQARRLISLDYRFLCHSDFGYIANPLNSFAAPMLPLDDKWQNENFLLNKNALCDIIVLLNFEGILL